MTVAEVIGSLLRKPTEETSTAQAPKRALAKYATDPIFNLETRSYQQQYGDMYFLRLTVLKPIVEQIAAERWNDRVIEGIEVQRVERVLDVRQGMLCWVTGTVYMEMSLKPNILDDISRDHFVAAPPSRDKYRDFENDQVMLEDESGRVRLTGSLISQEMLVTGCVVAIMGSELANGDFEAIDVLYPDLPEQVARPPIDDKKGKRYVALASGLAITGGLHESLETHLMVEYLTGELAGTQDQTNSASISRLILAGNSLADIALQVPDEEVDKSKKIVKKYGYDAAAYNSKPTANFDVLLSDLCSSINVTLMPGETDPANVSLPQQPIHAAMFPTAKAYTGTTFSSTTNPCVFEVEGTRFLGTSGQTISDIYKYVEGADRLEMMEKTLRWRHLAPTAPDTLWCYPYKDKDQFVIDECPHVYFVGNQPSFSTTVIEGPEGQTVRMITIPKFSETGEIVLMDLDTLECETINFKVATKSNPY